MERIHQQAAWEEGSRCAHCSVTEDSREAPL